MNLKLLFVSCLLLGFTSVSNASEGRCVGNSCVRQVVSAPMRVLHNVVPNVRSSVCNQQVEKPVCGVVESTCGSSKPVCKTRKFRLFR